MGRSRLPKRILAATVLILGVVCVIVALSLLPHTVRLSASEIQSQLERKFPLEKRKFIFTGQFTDPMIAIDPGTGQVTLGVSAKVSALGMKAISTRAEAVGGVKYESSTGELFLDSPKINVRQLEVAGLPDKDKGIAADLIEEVLREYLVRTPLYRIKGRDAKLFWLRRTLKSVRVKDGELELQFAL